MRISRGGIAAIALCVVLGWSWPCAAESLLLNGKGVIYGGMGAGYHVNSLDGEDNPRRDTYSRRFAFMASYGLASWMDVSARAGVADLDIEGIPGRKGFRGMYKPAIGAGMRIKLLELMGSTVVVYGEGSGWLFYSKGKTSWRTERGMVQSNVEYNWLEGEGSLGVEFPYFGFYGGARAQAVETESDHHVYEITDEEKVYIGRDSETYRSKLLLGWFIGKIFQLPGDFRLNIQVAVLDLPVSNPELRTASVRMELTQLYQPEEEAF